MSKKPLCKKVWLDHLSRQERSGATQKEYCREQDLSLSAFRYWKKRRSREATFGGTAFIEVPVPQRSREPMRDICTIEFPNGCTLRVHATGTVRELAQLVAMVRGL